MIYGLKPYPAIKDSGVPWLGEVPVHWQVLPNRALFAEVKDQNHSDEPLLSVTISRGVILQTELLSETSKKDSSNFDKSKYKLVQPGDIAYNKMRAWQSSIGASQFRGIISPAYIVQRPRSGVLAEYMHYLLRTPSFATEAERWSYGITSDQWSLRPEDFKEIYCSLPPKDEQSIIVRFLDHIDRRIRKYIRAKRRLIELLKEQKQAIINRAVTRGFDPNVRLKPSGIDWLGDVPEHWEIRRLKFLLREPLKYGANEPSELIDRDLPRYIRITDIAKNGSLLDDTFRSLPEDVANSYLLEDGDILLARSGATVGKTFIFKGSYGRAAYAGYLIKARFNHKLIKPQFAYIYLNSHTYWQWLLSSAIQATIQNVSAEKYANLPMPVPTLSEQERFLEEINNYFEPIDKTTNRTECELDLIREYRTRLIADVVTGKIDVRDLKLPEAEDTEGGALLEEPEGLEDIEEASEDENARE